MTYVSGDWLTSPATQAVFSLFERHGHVLYCVGGCVRNALLGLPVADVDMCSAVRPEQVLEICKAAGIRAVPTGIEHGTVTVVIDGNGFEVTTFRKDVETDGRRAVVAFSDNLEDDAHRRDFTINALYADRQGRVVDPLGGLPDLETRRLRFIDNPDQRIREDYLRILRFFRFFARFGAGAPEPDALDAIARNLEGLSRLSAERVTHELLSLLGLPDPSFAVGIMQQTGVLSAVLPGADARFLAPLIHMEQRLDLDPDPVPRLVALGSSAVLEPLRLSKAQNRAIDRLHAETGSTLCPAALGAVLGETAACQVMALRVALSGASLPEDARARVAWGSVQRFPLKAADLQPDYKGPDLGKRLERLRSAWLASCLTLTKDALRCLPDD